ncbi:MULTISPECIES: HEPN/Toprim-associated domain-containing protein [unclassified Streptomyces]|uniref:HEPN/Toprim-associated domain-containing protein n=1 Tax=unclassified Streptomyces TaxID=2593676 RepID=UPI002DD7B654|nr:MULTISPECIES: HEPN/Toprim-associated domain-containing protein [unclassified Streptomyces]WSC41019.1 HEPN/Toprim-associated domain-containing protein [Streptomyces sp. NBC_01763]WSC51877.1 HEPN/Toprim-associated domain-containing protein [Streptomyces sp. NBC_01761]WSF82726.1 HEPN/Toprim-associated domain-containing protein [Streptomyces sp. NBC_01744]
MGEYSGIYVSGSEIFTYRNESHQELEDIFTSADVVYLSGVEALPYSSAWHAGMLDCEVDEIEVYGLTATVADLRDRLNALGFGQELLRRGVNRLMKEQVDSCARMLEYFAEQESDGEHVQNVLEEMEVWLRLDFESWQALVAEWVKKKGVDSPNWRDHGPLDIFEGADSRLLLRALVEHFEGDDILIYDLTDYIIDSSPSDIDTGWLPVWQLDATPPVVITEGSFDATVLRGALELLRPELAPYVRFLDYSVGNEGGAAAAVRTLKNFAAAGIAHRIVAIFDNDSAAYEAVLGLRPDSLPEHYGVMHYPDLPLASAYPTLGPQGNSVMNVNRLAGSIELYLGKDVLESPDGELSPVQWKGYMHKVRAYQGEVTNKGALQSAFRAKLEAAKSDRSKIESQDWSGLNLLLDALLHKLSSLPAARPYNPPLTISDFMEKS